LAQFEFLHVNYGLNGFVKSAPEMQAEDLRPRRPKRGAGRGDEEHGSALGQVQDTGDRADISFSKKLSLLLVLPLLLAKFRIQVTALTSVSPKLLVLCLLLNTPKN
jgi:hypothetical protein